MSNSIFSKILCIGNFAREEVKIGNAKARQIYGGMGFRFVLACLALDVPCNYVTIIGKESGWQEIINKFQENSGMLVGVKKTTQSISFSWFYNKNRRLLSIKAKNLNHMDFFPDLINKTLIQKYQIVNVCSLGINNEEKIINILKANNKTITYIFHESNLIKTTPQRYFNLFNKIDFLFLNRKEASLLIKSKDLIRAGIFLSGIVKNVFITADKDGVFYFNNKKLNFHQKAFQVDIRDTSGAGDIFAGGFIAGQYLTKNNNVGCLLGTLLSALSLKDYGTQSLIKLLK